jgi:hypothetical protein
MNQLPEGPWSGTAVHRHGEMGADYYVDSDGKSTAARDWEAAFERETGKRIVDGEAVFVDVERSLLKAIYEYRNRSPNKPTRARVSGDTEKQLLLRALESRRFVPHGATLLSCFGVAIDTDWTLPPCTIVVDSGPRS